MINQLKAVYYVEDRNQDQSSTVVYGRCCYAPGDPS